MVELEADDALASGGLDCRGPGGCGEGLHLDADKDLAQYVRGDRVVQADRRGNKILNEEGVREKFGGGPALIPDYLALVGDAADGFPGIPGIGPKTAARLLERHGSLESFPPDSLPGQRELVLRFKVLATLRTDAPLFRDVDELGWRGPRLRSPPGRSA